MPWCEECAKYWTPSSMSSDGTCPTCGRPIDGAEHEHEPITAKNLDLKRLAAGGDGDDDVKAPWHFKVLVVLLVAYLGWRLVQLITATL